MKFFKIWFLGTLSLQLVMWTYIFILSTSDPAASWLIFINFYAFIISLIQCPLLTVTYLYLDKRLERWRWWHSFILWLGTYLLILIPAYVIYV